MDNDIRFAKNWAGFYEGLKEDYIKLENEKALSKEPLEQLELDKKLIFTNNLMFLYVDYLKTIGNDHGSKFLKTIEEQHEYYKNKANEQTDEQNNKIFLKIANLAVTKLREFRVFIDKEI